MILKNEQLKKQLIIRNNWSQNMKNLQIYPNYGLFFFFTVHISMSFLEKITSTFVTRVISHQLAVRMVISTILSLKKKERKIFTFTRGI